MIDQVAETYEPHADSAAIFAAALSLWRAFRDAAGKDPFLNLSDAFNGMDQMMREVMRIADVFERWACQHIKFQELEEVWPYLLEDRFGDVYLKLVMPPGLVEFNEEDCLRMALEMRLPISLQDGLRIPIDVIVSNPIPDSAFRQLRIQTVRDHLEDGDVHPFRSGDEPFDDEFTAPYFALYGVDIDGMSEHIADRRTYSDAAAVIRKIVPGVAFPEFPISA